MEYNEYPIRRFSYGGGVQSTYCLVLAALGLIDFKSFLFCNVGHDSGNRATLEYVEKYAKPYAEAHGIELIELHNTLHGEPITLYQQITRPGSRSIPIPVRMANGAPGNRSCTVDFKIKVVDRYLMNNGVREILQSEKAFERYKNGDRSQRVLDSLPSHPGHIRALFEHGKIARPLAVVGLGISLDEFDRMHDAKEEWKKNEYPLVAMRIDRAQCIAGIKKAGLPVPPKSSCKWCPFHRLSVWQDMRTNQPEDFQEACDLEDLINARRQELGKDPVYLTRYGKRLADVTTDMIQGTLFTDDEKCEHAGYCMI